VKNAGRGITKWRGVCKGKESKENQAGSLPAEEDRERTERHGNKGLHAPCFLKERRKMGSNLLVEKRAVDECNLKVLKALIRAARALK